MFTSDRLIEGEVYTKAMLAAFFEAPLEESAQSEVCWPDRTRYRSIWFFLSEEDERHLTHSCSRLEGNKLFWRSSVLSSLRESIVYHQKLGLELLCFHRTVDHPQPPNGFVYKGVFNFVGRIAGASLGHLELNRQNIAKIGIPASDKIHLELFESLLACNEDCETLYVISAVLWALRASEAIQVHFIPVSLLVSYVITNILSALQSEVCKFDYDAVLVAESLAIAKQLDLERRVPEEVCSTLDRYYREKRSMGFEVVSARILERLMNKITLAPSAKEVFDKAVSEFDEGKLPFILTPSRTFLQMHPLWLSYFEQHLNSLSRISAERIVFQLVRVANVNYHSARKVLRFDPYACALFSRDEDPLNYHKALPRYSRTFAGSIDAAAKFKGILRKNLVVRFLADGGLRNESEMNRPLAELPRQSSLLQVSLPSSDRVDVGVLQSLLDRSSSVYSLMLILSLIEYFLGKRAPDRLVPLQALASDIVSMVWTACRTHRQSFQGNEGFERAVLEIENVGDPDFSTEEAREAFSRLLRGAINQDHIDSLIRISYHSQTALHSEESFVEYLESGWQRLDSHPRMIFAIPPSQKFLNLNFEWAAYLFHHADVVRDLIILKILTKTNDLYKSASNMPAKLFPFWLIDSQMLIPVAKGQLSHNSNEATRITENESEHRRDYLGSSAASEDAKDGTSQEGPQLENQDACSESRDDCFSDLAHGPIIDGDVKESGRVYLASVRKVCPHCSLVAEEEQIEALFGYRMMQGIRRPQSYCKICRSSRERAEKNLEVDAVVALSRANAQFERTAQDQFSVHNGFPGVQFRADSVLLDTGANLVSVEGQQNSISLENFAMEAGQVAQPSVLEPVFRFSNKIFEAPSIESTAMLKLGPTALRNGTACLGSLHQMLLLSLLQLIAQIDSPVIPASRLSAILYTKIFRVVRLGLNISHDNSPLVLHATQNAVERIELREKTASRLLTHDHIYETLVLAMELEEHVMNALQQLDPRCKITALIHTTESFVSLDQEWFSYFAKENNNLQAWSAASLCAKLEISNKEKCIDVKAVFEGEPELIYSVQALLERSDLAVSREVLTGNEANKAFANSIDESNIDQKCSDVLPTEAGLDTHVLLKLFEHTTTTYKFLAFHALIRLLNRPDCVSSTITFETLLSEMLLFAAGVVRLNSVVSLGQSDRVLSELAKIGVKQQNFAAGWDSMKEEAVRSQLLSQRAHLNFSLLRYVPYLLIRSFLDDKISPHLNGKELNREIAALSTQLFNDRTVLYRIDTTGDSITVHPKWLEYLRQHYLAVHSWASREFGHCLLSRNPQLEVVSLPGTEHGSTFDFERLSSNARGTGAAIDENNEPEYLLGNAITDLVPDNSFYQPVSISESPLVISSEVTTQQDKNNSLLFIDGYDPIFPTTGLFSTIHPASSTEKIIGAFSSLVRRLDDMVGRRSLCQLNLSEQDFVWLTDWLSQLDKDTAQEFLVLHPNRVAFREYTYSCAIGTLFLVACAEINRKRGREGAIWPLFMSGVKGDLAPAIKSKRFEGQVNSDVRAALRKSFELLNLRNVLKADDHAQYLVSTYLQFGFTRYGVRQLPVWLANPRSRTESIRQLLSDNSANYSAEFSALWQSMSDFFYRRISEAQMKSVMTTSPWVYPEWRDDILRVIANPESRFSFPLPDPVGVTRAVATASSPVLVKLVWDYPQLPLIELSFAFERMNLIDGEQYKLKVTDKLYALCQAKDQSWFASGRVAVNLVRRELPVEVVDASGGTVFSEIVEIWQEKDVQVFDLSSGRRLDDEAELVTSRAYAILASSDLKADPLPPLRQSVQKVERILYLLQPGWSPSFSFVLEDEILWSALSDAGRPRTAPEVQKIKPVIEKKILAPGEPVNVTISGESERARVESLRVNGVSAAVVFKNGRTETAQPVLLGSSSFAGKAEISLKVRFDRKLYVVRFKVPVEVTGCAVFNGTAWDLVPEDAILSAQECTVNQYSFANRYLPNNPVDFGIFEGNTLRKRLTSGRTSLGALKGTGSKIEIRRVCNHGVDSPNIRVAAGSVNGGIISSMMNVNASETRFEFREPLELSRDHTILVWPDDSEPTYLKRGDLRQVSDRSWAFVPCTASSNVTIALAFSGLYQGAFWAANRSQFLRRTLECMEPLVMAAMLRWTKWPLLASDGLPAVRQLIDTYPAQALAGWLGSQGLPSDLTHDSTIDSTECADVVRELFEPWSPTLRCVPEITRYLAATAIAESFELQIAAAAGVLWRSSPILMAKYLRANFQRSVLEGTTLDRVRVLCVVEEDILNLHEKIDKFSEKEGFVRIVDECAQRLDVHESWVKNQAASIDELMSGETPSEESLNNLYSLTSFSCGRQFVSKVVVDYLKRTIKGA